MGRMDDARALYQRLIGLCNDVGLTVQAGRIVAASHAPRWPGVTRNETVAPTGMSRVPSTMAVQWKP